MNNSSKTANIPLKRKPSSSNQVSRIRDKRYFLRLKICKYAMTHGIHAATRQFGCSRNTVRFWLRRYEHEGPSGLKERSRAPHTCPHKTSLSEERKIVEARRQTPCFGPRRLRNAFGLKASCSAIYRILKEKGLMRKMKKENKKNDLCQVEFPGDDIYIPFEDQVLPFIIPGNPCPEEVIKRLCKRVRNLAKRLGQTLDEESTERLVSAIWVLAQVICYHSTIEECTEASEKLASTPATVEPWTEEMEGIFSFYKMAMTHLFPERYHLWMEWERTWWYDRATWKSQDGWEATWPKRQLICEFLFVLERMSTEEIEKLIEKEWENIRREEERLSLSQSERLSFRGIILTGEDLSDLPKKLSDVLRIHEAIQNGDLLLYKVKVIRDVYGIIPNSKHSVQRFVDIVTNWEQRAQNPGIRILKEVLREARLINDDPPENAEFEDLSGETKDQANGVQIEKDECPPYTWADVKIVIVDDSTLRVFVPGKRKMRVSREKAGFSDGRNEKPNEAWNTLLKLARAGFVPITLRSKAKIAMDMSRIRKNLERLTGLEKCPIHKKGNEYLPGALNLKDQRGAERDRAKFQKSEVDQYCSANTVRHSFCLCSRGFRSLQS